MLRCYYLTDLAVIVIGKSVKAVQNALQNIIKVGTPVVPLKPCYPDGAWHALRERWDLYRGHTGGFAGAQDRCLPLFAGGSLVHTALEYPVRI